MRRAIVVMVLLGCGSVAPQYGSFVQGRPAVQAAIATDAASKLQALYAPDAHAVRLAQDARDPFGRGLAAELRKRGYPVRQHGAPSAKDRASEVQLRYVLDAIKGTDLLRVTIYASGKRLSRAYAERSDGVHAAGPWSSGAL